MGGKPEYLHTPLTLAQTETNSRSQPAKKFLGETCRREQRIW